MPYPTHPKVHADRGHSPSAMPTAPARDPGADRHQTATDPRAQGRTTGAQGRTTGGRRPAQAEAPVRLPQSLAPIVRPELPSLLPEISEAVANAVPRYARYLEGAPRRTIVELVEQNLSSFADQVSNPAAPQEQRDGLCRRVGRYEAYEGHTMDDLQTAMWAGARVSLRRAQKVGKRHNLSPAIILSFTDTLFAYVEELIAVSREGHLEARAEMEGGRESHRTRLLHMLLAGAAVSEAKLAELAQRAEWALPDEVTLVACNPEAPPTRGMVAGDVLTDMKSAQPHVLLPGRVDAHRRAVLRSAPSDIRVAVGPTVPRSEAADSLRFARKALELARAGKIEDRPVTFCEDHLVTLWLQADPALTRHLVSRQLAPLNGLTPTQRDRLLETLRAWLATQGNAVHMAELLHLHPQTVRYRLRLLHKAFGDQLTDVDQRFATDIALRSLPAQPTRGGGRRGGR